MPSQYYYLLIDGSISGTGNTRIDPPDTESPYYIDGQYSQYWDTSWVARIDGTVSGYPENGQSWNFTTNTWYFTEEALKEAAREIRRDLEDYSTIFYLGHTVPVSVGNISFFSSLAQISRLENPTDTTGVLYDSSKNAISMSNEDFIGLVDAVLNHFQSIIDAEVQVVALIEDETITHTDDIDAAFELAMETPFQHIAPITDLYTTINGKATIADIAAALSALAEGIGEANASEDAITDLRTDYSPSSGYNSIINDGINDSNAAYNDLAAKYNDLATKMNILLAYLKAQ